MTVFYADLIYVLCIAALALFLIVFPQEKLFSCDSEQPDACLLPIFAQED